MDFSKFRSTSKIVVFAFVGLMSIGGCSDIPVDAGISNETAGFESAGKKEDRAVDGKDVAAWAKQLENASKKARHYHLLDRAIIRGGAGKMSASEDSVRLIVGFSNQSATADSVLSKVLEKYKILNRFEFKTALHGVAITMPAVHLDSFVTDMDSNSDVGWTEPDASVPTSSGSTGSTSVSTQHVPWGISNVGADLSWAASGDGIGEVGVDLYILDTGASSPDLNIVECLEFTRHLGAQPCASLDDPDGHGTEVAAVAAAKDNTIGIVGVAPGARVHVVKAMRENGNTVLGSLIAVVDYVTKRKLQNPSVPIVVNISLGSNVRTTRYNSLDEAIRTSIAAGVVYVISAGNDAIDAATVSPAHVAEAITVGAYDQANVFANFSNYGSVVDILAPGDLVTTLTTSGTLVSTSGTSLSAPHVAGAAALLLAQNSTMTPAAVRDMLIASSRANVTGVPASTTNKSLFVGN